MTLLLSTLWAQAARDWNPPSGNQYPSHAVVYATLFDASGQEVDNVADMRVGAFIDGECRAAANPVVRETPNGGRLHAPHRCERCRQGQEGTICASRPFGK